MGEQDSLRLTGCTIDLRHEKVYRDGGVQPLTSKEAELLRYLVERPGVAVSREDLLQEVWGYSRDVLSRAVDTAIRRIRQKVEVDRANPQHILTVFGLGYRFEPGRTPAGDSGSWRPASCPDPGPDAASLLGAARSLAASRGDGFVGLEHLLLSLASLSPAPSGPATAYAQSVLRSGRFMDRLEQLTPVDGEREPSWAGTPRLQELTASLDSGFSVEALWSAAVEAPTRGLCGLDLETSLAPEPSGAQLRAIAHWGMAPSEWLEVVGGPEDGRRLLPAVGEWIGRWWPDRRVDHGLYEGTVLEDSSVSRGGALQWLGEGRARLKRRGTLLGWDRSAFLPGATRGTLGVGMMVRTIGPGEEVRLQAGDLLAFRGTLLRGLSSGSG